MNLAYAASHYFLPRQSNNQKAKILHNTTVFFFILYLIAFQIVLQLLPSSGIRILGYAANIPVEKVVVLTNQKRLENGLSELEINSKLNEAARVKGENMLADDYWAHIAPDGTQPWDFFVDAGYKYRFAGENLARDFSNPQAAIDAWMASPTHRDNMLSSKYKEIGVAVVEGDMNGVETTIIVQLFGTQYTDTLPQLPVASAEVGEEVVKSPTQAPTRFPQPTETSFAPIASSQDVKPPIGSSRVLVSPFSTTKSVSLMTVFILLMVLIFDAIITSRRKVSRIGGRTFAHLAFLGMILAVALIARAGSIL